MLINNQKIELYLQKPILVIKEVRLRQHEGIKPVLDKFHEREQSWKTSSIVDVVKVYEFLRSHITSQKGILDRYKERDLDFDRLPATADMDVVILCEFGAAVLSSRILLLAKIALAQSYIDLYSSRVDLSKKNNKEIINHLNQARRIRSYMDSFLQDLPTVQI